MVNPYFDRKSAARVRRRERGRRQAKRLLSAVLGLTAAATAVFLVQRYGLYRVRSLDVRAEGSHREILSKDLSACLGRPLWDCRADSVVERFLAAQPAAKRVRIWLWPWGRLSAWAELRRPVARVAPGWGIDEQGVVFPCPSAQGLPELNLSGASQEGIRRAVAAILASPRQDGGWRVEAKDPQDVVVTLPGPYVIRLGNGRFVEKWQRFWELWDGESRPPAPGVIDLRFQGQAIYRPQV